MAVTVVDDRQAIKRYNGQFVDSFRKAGTRTIKAIVGYRGGSELMPLYWNEHLGIWFGASTAERRYWNAFGTVEPREGKGVSISCEINFPMEGIDRRIGAAFVSADERDVLIVHRGRIGGGRKGIGSELFRDNFSGSWLVTQDASRESEVAVVGALAAERSPKQIAAFVREVERIKRLRNASAGPFVQPQFQPNEFEKEHAGKRRYSLSRSIEADCDHAIVVNALRDKLATMRYTVGNDRFRDLYIHKNGLLTCLFEAKSDTSTTNIYTAIGQLYLHSANLPSRPKLFLVVPNDLDQDLERKLAKLKINVVRYSWAGDEPEFATLCSHAF